MNMRERELEWEENRYKPKNKAYYGILLGRWLFFCFVFVFGYSNTPTAFFLHVLSHLSHQSSYN